MRKAPRSMWLFLSLLLAWPASLAAQVAPVQPTAVPNTIDFDGNDWLGDWPDTVKVEPVSLDNGVEFGVLATTDHFDCTVASNRGGELETSLDSLGATFDPDAMDITLMSYLAGIRSIARGEGVTVQITQGEKGEELLYAESDHAWTLLTFTSDSGSRTNFTEFWQTSLNDAVWFDCYGPTGTDFNASFGEFLAIRNGISFPYDEFNPAGTPFAGYEATSAPSDEDTPPAINAQERFNALAQFAADILDTPSADSHHYVYADIAGQASALGATPPASLDSPDTMSWITAIWGLPKPFIFDYVMFEEFEPAFGFHVSDINRSLELRGDESYMILTGALDGDRIGVALLASGYHEERINGAVVWIFHGDGYLDWDYPATSIAVGTMNYAVMLSDDTVAFARTRATIESVIETHLGLRSSLADNSDVQNALAAARPDLVSAILFPGSWFNLDKDDYESFVTGNPNIPPRDRKKERLQLDEIEARYGDLRPAGLVLLGESAGGWVNIEGEMTLLPGASQQVLQLIMAFDNREDASTAASIMPVRFAVMWSSTSRVPLARMIDVLSSGTDSSGMIAVIDLNPQKHPQGLFYSMLTSKDMRFLATRENAAER